MLGRFFEGFLMYQLLCRMALAGFVFVDMVWERSAPDPSHDAHGYRPAVSRLGFPTEGFQCNFMDLYPGICDVEWTLYEDLAHRLHPKMLLLHD